MKSTSRLMRLSSVFVASAIRCALAFTASLEHNIRLPSFRYIPQLSLSSNDDWGMEPDPRMEAMRSMLEKSWNSKSMGTVPARPEKAAEAAAESVAVAMGKQNNILMIDLRLPSYDITEGPKLYDKKAVYDFCACLSDQLRERKLIRKSLVLVRNEMERRDTERASQLSREEITIDDDEESWTDSEVSETNEIDQFRKKLMDSWDTPADKLSSLGAAEQKPESKLAIDPNSSHRLWSMIGNEEITSGSDMFEQVIAAVDKHARLVVTGPSAEQEDALIIVSPYDTTDLIAVRRILARYGQTRTIIIVNSRLENLPAELNSAVLVYAVLPLVAKSRSKDNVIDDDDSEAGLKVVVMKRFPENWCIFVDVYGDGFVQVGANGSDEPSADSKEFPSSEWIVRNVQAHVQGL